MPVFFWKNTSPGAKTGRNSARSEKAFPAPSGLQWIPAGSKQTRSLRSGGKPCPPLSSDCKCIVIHAISRNKSCHNGNGDIFFCKIISCFSRRGGRTPSRCRNGRPRRPAGQRPRRRNAHSPGATGHAAGTGPLRKRSPCCHRRSRWRRAGYRSAHSGPGCRCGYRRQR